MSDAAVTTPISSAPRAFRGVSIEKAFYTGSSLAFLLVVVTSRPQSLESAIGAVAILIAATIPSAIWIRHGARGLPLFPIFALTHIGTYGLPLIRDHPVVSQFPPDAHLMAGLSVAAYLLVGTVVWYPFSRRNPQPVVRPLLLTERHVDLVLLTALSGAAIFDVGMLAGWFPLSPGVYSIFRAIIIAFNTLSCFVLSFRLGTKSLSPTRALIFKIVVTGLVIVQMPGLLMINAMTLIGICVFGYTLGARRAPWRLILIGTALFGFLHFGKGEMRSHYWSEANEDVRIHPLAYPAYFGEWAKASLDSLVALEAGGDAGATLLERASLMHVYLFVQTMTPEVVPYIGGETYTIIPGLLVPRILNPNKPASHEGTYLLNIHYGFQTREDTTTTTLAFGMPSEAHANFGITGLLGLGVVSGLFYGAVEKQARGVPALSFRYLLAVIVMNYAIQVEYTASVYVTGLFQSLMALIGLAVVFMRRTVIRAIDQPPRP
jgi:hypothetical protein